MSNVPKRNIQIPVVITHDTNYCDIFIPDLHMTIHGIDYIDALANAHLHASAIYFYNIERNVKLDLKTTYADAERMCKRNGSFATFISLTA